MGQSYGTGEIQHEYTHSQFNRVRIFETLTALGSAAAVIAGIKSGESWWFIVSGEFAIAAAALEIGRREIRDNLDETTSNEA